MPKACVKTVDNWCINTGKKCVRLSTQTTLHAYYTMYVGVKSLLLPQLHHPLVTCLSTINYHFSPLLKSHLYPLSTAPIISITN